MKQLRPFLVAILLPIAGLVHAADASPNALALTAPGVTPRWGEGGHRVTTFQVAQHVGIDERTALRLAYFSQAPDDIWYAYSAPFIGLVGLPWWNYRHRIVAVLHSLHGGDYQAVIDRRARLAAMVKAADLAREEDHWKTGFLIHALGDSYAHVHPAEGDADPQAVTAYKELFGHVFDNCEQCTRPDDIPRHPAIYAAYFTALEKALTRDGVRHDGSLMLPANLAVLSADDAQQARSEITFSQVDAFLMQLTEDLEKD